jgi:hypothetical protein
MRGSSAGPSKLPLAQAAENESVMNEIAIIRSDANDCMWKRLLYFFGSQGLREQIQL